MVIVVSHSDNEEWTMSFEEWMRVPEFSKPQGGVPGKIGRLIPAHSPRAVLDIPKR